ncbi:MAG TPA: pantoate--beta-alanine ligase [Limnochordia bacterium]|nr:pantoate--beta-alanine ligase [Limnochordia bacterium]
MQIAHTIAGCRDAIAGARRRGERIGLVPTMGALHAGHGELLKRAASECDFAVASIFVNPLQFGPGEDYERYPRAFAADTQLCRTAGVALVFAPGVDEMYPSPTVTTVAVEQLSAELCGRSRPGHFRGVATVVTKLFNIVQPDVAYFGEKDAQQLALIRRMVYDLNQPVRIVGVPTVREPDGLAMSSRNAYLGAKERAEAPVLYAALQEARRLVEAGERDTAQVRTAVARTIAARPLARLDYVEVVDAGTLQKIDRIDGPALAAVAVYFGRTRLIDNVRLEPAVGQGERAQ